ncbi:MAG: hypothetical protein Q7P63_17440 [Verrucomicrobiota bacterium JB022]|nr:hypothetical protein [Verrucomicrobiota bacterium JB022]
MANSVRKSPSTGITTADSEKEDKRTFNRTLRRVNRQILKADGDRERLKQVKEVSDPWAMAKDGKCRFDPIEDRRLLRK